MSRLDLVTEALEGLKATEHLDEDWAVPCSNEHSTPRRAEWLVTWQCACPPGAFVACSACKDELVGAPLIVCRTCRTHYRPGITATSLIEPLNRRTA